jgi:hypothetical protein
MNAEAEHPEELEHFKEMVTRHGASIAIGAGVVLIAVVVVLFIRGRGESSERDALALLASARTITDLEAVANNYSGTPTAPLAILRLAKGYYDSGNFGLAVQKYDSFASQYAEHPFAPAAVLGKTHCIEAQGRLQEALGQYRDFVSREPEHFLMSQAVFGEGRCLESLWKLEDARIVYETFMAENPDSPWLARVEDMLAAVNRKIARGDTAPAPTLQPAFGVPVAPQLPEFNF